jgi:uncharacterized coiled-coil protein SlyX
MEQRLNELETRLAFQEKTMEELHEALVYQQLQLDKTEKELLKIMKLLALQRTDETVQNTKMLP